uniref:Uncharacterized protein n=1 Tax=Timema monikensis TaxID=170555 RepID=A0A7R9E1T4_9NEOP|nr:unnamed protein product [Timema monikensis]
MPYSSFNFLYNFMYKKLYRVYQAKDVYAQAKGHSLVISRPMNNASYAQYNNKSETNMISLPTESGELTPLLAAVVPQMDAVEGALGAWGRWQLRVCLLVALVKVPSAWHMASILFTAPAPKSGRYWCARPPQFSHWTGQDWLNYSHPPHPTNTPSSWNIVQRLFCGVRKSVIVCDDAPAQLLEHCQEVVLCREKVCDSVMTLQPSSWNIVQRLFCGEQRDPCNVYEAGYEMLTRDWEARDLVGNGSTIACREFEYLPTHGMTHTVVTQWHLVCERQVLVVVSQFLYLLGILVGGFVCWRLLFRYSPRTIMISAMVVQVLAGVGVAYAPHFEIQVTLRFITAAACAHMFTCGYVICTDITGGWWKQATGACYEHMWSLGVITLPILTSMFTDWRNLQLAISLPTLLLLVVFWWIPDSPRWLLSHGREEEAVLILEEGAASNGRATPSVAALPAPAKRKIPDELRWIELFSRQEFRWSMCALHLAFAATTVTYYGSLLNVKNLGDNLLINFGIAGKSSQGLNKPGVRRDGGHHFRAGSYPVVLLEVAGPGFDSRHGRRAPWNQDGVMLALGMVGRVAIASSLTMLQVGSPELFPPELRRLGGVSCVTFGRIILLSAIFIVSLASYGKNVSLSTFGGITVIGGLATLYLGLPKNDSLSAQFKRKLQCVWSVENREKTNNNISSPNKLGADEIVERYTSILGDGNMIV